MKLAEALHLRSAYQKKVESLSKRICDNLKVAQGDAPTENPHELLAELLNVNDRLGSLIIQINERNHEVALGDGRRLSQALIERDTLMKKRNLLASIAEYPFQKEFHMPRVLETKVAITLPINELHKQIDDLSRDFRELDNMIQSVNWSTDL